ncbi:hypothetical protein [Novosphingobium sp.]|uniref:hypothetical protein n=1 Tax=Novosphingobium sp. TaxID=1874826 RepID=UPI0025CEE441|nr:hypothetical protein [Novosphingobium sp.]MCC6924754.1 hypothetical protein [Novosphingobium sp.]
MRINIVQRNMLVAASALLAILWIVQVAAEGLEDSHWIAIVPMIAGLMFVALSSQLERKEAPKALAVTRDLFAANNRDEGSAIVALRFDECARQWEAFIKSSMVDRIPKATAKDRDDMAPFLDMAATKLAFANYLLIILHRGAEAHKSDDLKALRIHAAGKLTYAIHQNLIHISTILSGLEPPNRQDSLSMAMQQMAEYEALIKLCQTNFASSSPFPLDPLYTKVNDEVKFAIESAADRETFFGIKYREETGRLLHPKPGITRV